ncbi:hypothetical protein AB0L26_27930 [Streptomyces nondiastaticus]|uniref:hypothetical protein n=1 Tax=Streptomyces nondiastaticus TaxID=3154512 RepID=UPI0034376333
MPEPSLMAAGYLRDALTAYQRGETSTVIAALMCIDEASWHLIQTRLAQLAGSFPELLEDVHETTRPTTSPES